MRFRTVARPLATGILTSLLISAQVSAQESADTAGENLRRPGTVKVGLGASFDFLNQLSATDLYGDIEVVFPNIWNRVGVDAGMFNGRATGRATPLDSVQVSAIVPHGSDEIALVSQTVTQSETVHDENLGLYVGLLWEANQSLFVTLQAEVLQQERTRVIDGTVTQIDTLETAPRTADNPFPGVSGPGPAASSSSLFESLYRSQFSAGVVFRHSGADALVYVKPLVGVGAVQEGWKGLFSIRFAVSSPSHGFRLGGDVRGRLDDRDEMSIVVYLAKTFSLAKLGEFVGTGEGGA